MDPLHDPEEFGRRVRSARGYLGLSRPEFAKLLGYTGDSTIDRAERGDIGKKRNNPEGRLAFAEEVIRRAKVPPAMFGLSEPTEVGARGLSRIEDVEAQLPGLKRELLAEIARVQDVLDARLRRLERGGGGAGAAGG